jgi:hypothetical protein
VAGEGIVLAAEPRDDLGEVAGGDLVRRLEHQVLEEVGDARDARRLVGRADAIPDVVGDDGRAMVRHDHHLQPVAELELADPAAGWAGVQRLEALDEHREGGCEEEKEEAAIAWCSHRSTVPDGEALAQPPSAGRLMPTSGTCWSFGWGSQMTSD